MSTYIKAHTHLPRGAYIQSIFDPVQSHAVYGIHEENLNEVKEILKLCGANKFRTIKGTKGWRILAFNFKKATAPMPKDQKW